MRARLAVVALMGLACGDDPAAPVDLRGEFPLEAIDGQQLPNAIVTTGTLILEPDLDYSLYASHSGTLAIDVGGHYARRASSIDFYDHTRPDCCEVVSYAGEASADGRSVTVTITGVTYLFRR